MLVWNDVVNDQRINIRPAEKAPLRAHLNNIGLTVIGAAYPLQVQNKALLDRMLKWMPCLYTQVNEPTSADSIVHLVEITLKARIDSTNVYNAFVIQNPNSPAASFAINAQNYLGVAGDISEALCSEVLTNEGLPELELDSNDCHLLKKGHISLNKGKMREVKAFGDILIPCAPSNIIISVKTQAVNSLLRQGKRKSPFMAQVCSVPYWVLAYFCLKSKRLLSL